MSVLLITHDLGIVASYATKVAVMYAGQIVEEADTLSLFKNPKHPYTHGLLSSIPSMRGDKAKRLRAIPGVVPHLAELPHGCRFQDRCDKKTDECCGKDIDLVVQDERSFRCLYPY